MERLRGSLRRCSSEAEVPRGRLEPTLVVLTPKRTDRGEDQTERDQPQEESKRDATCDQPASSIVLVLHRLERGRSGRNLLGSATQLSQPRGDVSLPRCDVHSLPRALALHEPSLIATALAVRGIRLCPLRFQARPTPHQTNLNFTQGPSVAVLDLSPANTARVRNAVSRAWSPSKAHWPWPAMSIWTHGEVRTSVQTPSMRRCNWCRRHSPYRGGSILVAKTGSAAGR